MQKIIDKKSIFNRFHIDFVLFLLIILISLYGVFIMWSASGQNCHIMQHKILQII